MKATLKTDKREVNIEELTIETLSSDTRQFDKEIKEVELKVKLKLTENELNELFRMFTDSSKYYREKIKEKDESSTVKVNYIDFDEQLKFIEKIKKGE